ncbi:all trans-polyprenyl-diphosphate synthase PDSS2-like [Arctopsyche grandis]|uniref:all trans-polyprenyl-diphosphate synthase PDSS2-like n=1 Tax=Arctopsyche grandis TaxID=121162 RepID=UPI00406D67A9
MLKNVSIMPFKRCSSMLLRCHSTSETDYKSKWVKTVIDAEKLVEYTSSIDNLRWLLKDTSSNIGAYIKKLDGSTHPILKISKSLLSTEKSSIQMWGLLIKLVSKAAGYKGSSDQLETVVQNQQVLAEVSELIKIGHLVHTGILNHTEKVLKDKLSEVVNGNKIALLTGDLLLVKANGMLSNIRNAHVNEMISSALRDLTDGEFIGERDLQNFPMPSVPAKEKPELIFNPREDLKLSYFFKPSPTFDSLDTNDCIGNPVREWTMRTILGGGTLLGRSCEGTVHLAGHDQEFQNNGFVFGCHASLVWQASADINTFNSTASEAFSLVSAPVLFGLYHNPSLYDLIKPGFNDEESVEFDQIRKIIKEGPALDYTKTLLQEHKEGAIKCLENFPISDSRIVLEKMVEYM